LKTRRAGSHVVYDARARSSRLEQRTLGGRQIAVLEHLDWLAAHVGSLTTMT
jgi:hypothetical protein